MHGAFFFSSFSFHTSMAHIIRVVVKKSLPIIFDESCLSCSLELFFPRCFLPGAYVYTPGACLFLPPPIQVFLSVPVCLLLTHETHEPEGHDTHEHYRIIYLVLFTFFSSCPCSTVPPQSSSLLFFQSSFPS